MVLDKKVFGRQLQGLHLLGATKMNAPEMVITEYEGEQLAGVCSDIIKEYGLNVSTKMALFTQAILVCGSIYGPRLMTIKKRKESESKQQAYPFPQGD